MLIEWAGPGDRAECVPASPQIWGQEGHSNRTATHLILELSPRGPGSPDGEKEGKPSSQVFAIQHHRDGG
jgi:hypothetical protein